MKKVSTIDAGLYNEIGNNITTEKFSLNKTMAALGITSKRKKVTKVEEVKK